MKSNFLISLLFFPFCLLAQSNYRESYLVTKAGDTTRGFIDYKEWHKNPDRIRFRSTRENGEATDYTSSDIHSFKILGNESYKSFTVSISMNRLNSGDLTEEIDTAAIIKTCFPKRGIGGRQNKSLLIHRSIKKSFLYFKN